MSTIVFAGAAQFAAVGYVVERAGLAGGHPADRAAQRAPPALLGGPRAVAPRGPAPRRALMAHLLTDEAFALSHRPLLADRPDRRARLLDRRDRLDVHPVEPGHAGRGDHRRPDPGSDPARARRRLPGGDDRPRGRADHRPTRAGRGTRRRRSSRLPPALPSGRRSGSSAAGSVGPLLGMAVPGPAARRATHDSAAGLP